MATPRPRATGPPEATDSPPEANDGPPEATDRWTDGRTDGGTGFQQSSWAVTEHAPSTRFAILWLLSRGLPFLTLSLPIRDPGGKDSFPLSADATQLILKHPFPWGWEEDTKARII